MLRSGMRMMGIFRRFSTRSVLFERAENGDLRATFQLVHSLVDPKHGKIEQLPAVEWAQIALNKLSPNPENPPENSLENTQNLEISEREKREMKAGLYRVLGGIYAGLLKDNSSSQNDEAIDLEISDDAELKCSQVKVPLNKEDLDVQIKKVIGDIDNVLNLNERGEPSDSLDDRKRRANREEPKVPDGTVAKDLGKAQFFFEHAAELDDVDSLLALGMMTSEEDPKLAQKRLERAYILAENNKEQRILVLHAMASLHGATNTVRSLAYLEEAALLGCGEAAFTLFEYYHQSKDQRASEFLERAIELNNDEARHAKALFLLYLAETHVPEEQRPREEQGGELQINEITYDLSVGGSKQKKIQAATAPAAAAVAAAPTAPVTAIVPLISLGDVPTPFSVDPKSPSLIKDPTPPQQELVARALHLLDQSTRGDSHTLRGRIHLFGLYGQPVNFSAALAQFLAGSAKGDHESDVMAGHMYLYGVGAKSNPWTAYHYYNNAVGKHPVAMRYLAAMFRHGQEVLGLKDNLAVADMYDEEARELEKTAPKSHPWADDPALQNAMNWYKSR